MILKRSLPDISVKILAALVFISFSLRFIMIFKYGNRLTLSSDDLNYVQSAVLLLKKGIFTFFNRTEPTVFVMPLYPFFLAVIFSVFGSGPSGITAVRLIQSGLGALDIILVYMIAKMLFGKWAGVIAAAIMAFYLPAITTSGYILTENLFTTLLLLLILLSLKFTAAPGVGRFAVIGAVWALAVLIRPTIALFPAFLLIYVLIYYRKADKRKADKKLYRTVDIVRYGAAMVFSFAIIMLPWIVRNYKEYGEFIPLSAASGNPMLQGTYINYRIAPGETATYSEGKTTYERNRNEVDAAKKRISQVFSQDFATYLNWYTVGKTRLFWGTVFYWRQFFGVNWTIVLKYHYFILLGFLGILLALARSFRKYFFPVSILLYFNLVHCVYMAFDRYAYPLIPILAIFCAFLLLEVLGVFRKYVVKSTF